ncbi:uncharacterized protein LOC132066004 [Lycium ferocissimum]|uniref:uncharacterized protein LOC132066004 n=1 Tax=Lycium ferocissimum TaxID=112874 RepID=UPI0028169E4B|nr:uncharacterized protein LOC132066004 [Lycium ferocissimum]
MGIHYATNIYMEALALVHGLKIAIQKDLLPLVIKTDCKELINMLSNKSCSYQNLIDDCRYLFHTEARRASIKHIFREANEVADQLTKKGCKLDIFGSLMMYPTPPAFVICTILKRSTKRIGQTSPMDKKSSVGWIGVRAQQVRKDQMAAYQILGAILQDGHSTTRPPYFNGEHYCHWKESFKIFVQSTNYQAWIVIKEGPKPIPNVDAKDINTKIDLESHDVTKEQQETLSTNAREIALLYCARYGEEYVKISNCETAKEMWDKLEAIYEGTSKVRETKIDALRHDYEAFSMMHDENIESMFTRFSNIIGEIKSLGVTYTNSQQVRKLFRSLPKTWETKAIVLEDGNLDNFTYDELRGNLMAFEKNHIQRYQKDEKKKMVAFKSQAEESDDEFKEEEVSMISRHVIEGKRRSRNNRKGNSNFRKGKSSVVQRNDGKCYECEKYGHIASECPDAKRKPSKNCQKQRAFISWSEDEVSEDDEEGMTNICFMAIGKTSEVRPYHCSNCSETQELLDQTLEDLNRVFNEYKKLKRERRDWELKLEVVEIERDLLQEEVEDLKLQLNVLRVYNNKSTGKRPISNNNTSEKSKGDKSLFKSVADFDGGLVTFGDNSTGTLIGTRTISFNNSCDISNIYLVEGLKYNL